MYRETARLLLYDGLAGDSVLSALSDIFRDWSRDSCDKDFLISRVYAQVRRILGLADSFGLDGNLWHAYLTWVLMNSCNPFTLSCERAAPGENSLSRFAREDFSVFHRLFHYDFSALERDLGIDCLSELCHYRAPARRIQIYNRDASRQISVLSRALSSAENAGDIFALMTAYYRQYGVGAFAVNRIFRLCTRPDQVDFTPLGDAGGVTLDELAGYEMQKQTLRRNTEAFLAGRPANNVLLYGDAGTGKSTSVRALAGEYFGQGLRIIEVSQRTFAGLTAAAAQLRSRNYHFILLIDDLSFEENDPEYKFLKAAMEGGVDNWPENVLIYATSNRRHLVRETWSDRTDMEHQGDIHRSDTVEEKLSLAARFGVRIHYGAPSPREYLDIVRELAARRHLDIDEKQLLDRAKTWEVRNGSFSGRSAQQFIRFLQGSAQSIPAQAETLL